MERLPATGVGGHALHVDGDICAEKGREVEGHVVVGMFTRQADVDRFGGRAVVAADECQLGLGGAVLDGQQEKSRGVVYADEVVLACQVADGELWMVVCPSLRGLTEQQGKADGSCGA